MSNGNHLASRQLRLTAPLDSFLSFLFFFVCLCTPGIAGYKSLKVKIEPANSYAFHQQQGTITIAADPYETKEKDQNRF